MISHKRSCAVATMLGSLVWVGATGPATAQIPDEFSNLTVLPKDIGKRELVDIMRNFSGALGVRCDFCHVAKTSGSLEGMDFATDDLGHKQVARTMMKMTHEINTALLPKKDGESSHEVRCVTCHRGVKEPVDLVDTLFGVAEADGVTAAEKRYRELRDEYYGSGSYDFRPSTLNSVAERLATEKGDVAGAIELMKLNVELNPDAANSHLFLGQLHAQAGDKDAAVSSVERAIELDPDNDWAKRMLQRLGSAD